MSVLLFGLIQQLAAGVLTGAIVTLADRSDTKKATKQAEAVAALREKLIAWKLPEERGAELPPEIARAFGDHDPAVLEVAEQISSDETITRDIVALFLEVDDDTRESLRAELADRLSRRPGVDREKVERFLALSLDRMSSDLGLAAMRRDAQFAEVLKVLREQSTENVPTRDELAEQLAGFLQHILENLTAHSEQQACRIEQVLKDQQKTGIEPIVCKGDTTEGDENRLLQGGRPRQRDMRAGYAFTRVKLDDALRAILGFATGPMVIRIKAGPRRGKTTFAYQVARACVKRGYAAFERRADAAGHWPDVLAEESAAQERPLIIVWDDALNVSDRLAAVVGAWDSMDPPPKIVRITTEREETFGSLSEEKCPQGLREARAINLNAIPATEVRRAVEHIESVGLATVDPTRREDLIKGFETRPDSAGFFHDLIRAATGEYRSIDEQVEAWREDEGDTTRRQAFDALYTLACIPGQVGLELPTDAAAELLDARTYGQAIGALGGFPASPLQEEGESVATKHDSFAESFLDGRDWCGQLSRLARWAVDEPDRMPWLGLCLEGLRSRGHAEAVKAAVDVIHDRLAAYDWTAIGEADISYSWGSVLWHLDMKTLAADVNAAAVRMEPDTPRIHVNLALCIDSSEPEEAERHYQRALELREEDPEAHINYAILLAGLDRPKEAERHYQRALELREEAPEAHANFAIMLIGQGRYPEAIVHSAHAILLRGLPDCGWLLVRRWAEAADGLAAIAENPTDAPEGENPEALRGAAAGLWVATQALEETDATNLRRHAARYLEDPEMSEQAKKVCGAILGSLFSQDGE